MVVVVCVEIEDPRQENLAVIVEGSRCVAVRAALATGVPSLVAAAKPPIALTANLTSQIHVVNVLPAELSMAICRAMSVLPATTVWVGGVSLSHVSQVPVQ